MQPLYVVLALYSGSVIVAFSAGLVAWRRRRVTPAARWLAMVMFALAWWAGADILQVLLPEGPWRGASVYATFPGIAGVVAGFYLETRSLVDRSWAVSRRTRWLLSIHPVTLLIVVITDPWHHRFIRGFAPGDHALWVSWYPGPLFWAHTGYSYLVLGWCFVHLARGRRRVSRIYRRQLDTVLAAALVPMGANMVTVLWPDNVIGSQLTTCFFVLSGLLHYYAVFRLGLLRLLPVARSVVLDQVSDAIYVVDPSGTVIDLNPAAVRLTRLTVPTSPPELIGRPAKGLVPQDDAGPVLSEGQHHVVLATTRLDLDVRINELADHRGQAIGQVVVVRDITELTDQRRKLAEANERLVQQVATIDRLRHSLAEQAVRDELTGLHNRRHLITQLDEALLRARRDDIAIGVILLDIDHFKGVNDRFGHAIGDELLKATAATLVGSLRATDTVARYGGEEFVILLPGARLADGLRTAELLRQRCADTLVESPDGPVSATVSVGVAAFPYSGTDRTGLLQAADEALYAAKAAGRDRVIAAPR